MWFDRPDQVKCKANTVGTLTNSCLFKKCQFKYATLWTKSTAILGSAHQNLSSDSNSIHLGAMKLRQKCSTKCPQGWLFILVSFMHYKLVCDQISAQLNSMRSFIFSFEILLFFLKKSTRKRIVKRTLQLDRDDQLSPLIICSLPSGFAIGVTVPSSAWNTFLQPLLWTHNQIWTPFWQRFKCASVCMKLDRGCKVSVAEMPLHSPAEISIIQHHSG